jgi:hypothetical protein
LLPFFDLPQLPNGDSVVVTVHGLLGTDETIDVQNPTGPKRQVHFNALLHNGIKIANAADFTKAGHEAQIGFQAEVLQAGALFRSQIEGQVRPGTMHRMQAGSERIECASGFRASELTIPPATSSCAA